jgi:hypothetical protein
LNKIKNLFDIPSVKTYLDHIGAYPTSMRRAMIKERTADGKYWQVIAKI